MAQDHVVTADTTETLHIATDDTVVVRLGASIRAEDLFGPNIDGIYANGVNNRIEVYGVIESAMTNATGIRVNSGNTITVNGNVSAQRDAIWIGVDGASTSTNVLTIGGTLTAAARAGINIFGIATITHTGRTDGVENRIEGGMFGIAYSAATMDGDQLILTNSGHIKGGVAGVKGSAGADKIINTGHIEGESAILLGRGDDLYDGRGGGTVTGAIELGHGQDTAYGSDSIEIIFAGDGHDSVYGGGGSDSLSGDADNDTLDGGAGIDQMEGGDGDDLYYVGDVDDVILEAEGANSGYDRVIAFSTYTLSANVEYLQLAENRIIDGTGNTLDNDLIGNDHANKLDGGAGADHLSGGGGSDTLIGGADADNLAGGLGDDIYMIDAGDVLSEAADAGTDMVIASASYTLLADFENLALGGSAALDGTGNGLANVITGNGGANVLKGEGGDDSLQGGAGADRLDGGVGSDTYWVDNAGDVVVDAGEGFDRVLALADHALAANVEYLAFEGTGNFKGTGNDLDNDMFGNVGANILDGGAGRDKLDGGEGNDLLQGGAGDDTITDWRGDDIIDGGLGNDDLRGGSGNDVYRVDGGDTVTETAGQGTDTLIASQSFTLSATSEVEVLETAAGSAAIHLTGSGIANRITGNAGANALKGEGGSDTLTGAAGNDTLGGGDGDDRVSGGAGKDVLSGGTGKDIFVFDVKANKKTNLDKVTDYVVKDDVIHLDDAAFKAFSKKAAPHKNPLTLSAKAFWTGSAAHDGDDRIIYNKKTGALFYDDDGTGAHAAVQIATLAKKLKMNAKEFLII